MLYVRSLFEKINYYELILFIFFIFFFSGKETKRGVLIHHLTRNASKFRLSILTLGYQDFCASPLYKV